MTEEEIKAIIRQEMPQILQDREMRDYIVRSVNNYFAGKQETESRFDQILEELRRDREEQSRKWDKQNRKWEEYTQEQNRKWDEQNRKWDEQNRKWEEYTQEQNRKWEENQRRIDQTLEEIKAVNRKYDKYDSNIGALGARWGLHSEESFRNALKGILEASFGVQVVNITEYDDRGEVFGRPDQVELDLLIKNGLLIICEIKSSISKSDIYIFEKKVQFYQRRHQREANRKIVISPMVAPNAQEVAKNLDIEVYSYARDVEVS
jgi:hypothetical protein